MGTERGEQGRERGGGSFLEAIYRVIIKNARGERKREKLLEWNV